ncbi:hypothetical protein Tco_0324818 [Tanacetum coccineum]
MFTHDPRSAKVSKGFESTNLQGRVNNPGSSIFAARTSRTSRLRYKSWNSSSRVGPCPPVLFSLFFTGYGGFSSISGLLQAVWEMTTLLKLSSSSVTRYSIGDGLQQQCRFCWSSRFAVVVSEQDELPSSIGLEFRARLDGDRMYSGHLEAKRLP